MTSTEYSSNITDLKCLACCLFRKPLVHEGSKESGIVVGGFIQASLLFETAQNLHQMIDLGAFIISHIGRRVP